MGSFLSEQGARTQEEQKTLFGSLPICGLLSPAWVVEHSCVGILAFNCVSNFGGSTGGESDK